jgi:hypothetical protein
LSSPSPGVVRYRTAQTLIFDVGGRECTDMTAEAAMRRAQELRLRHVLLASTTGWTARRALAAAKSTGFDGKLIVVGEHTGYHGRGHQAMAPQVRRELEQAGATVFIGTHALSGPPRSFRLRWGGIDTAEIAAETLRRISRGTKTCVEIALMAADADLIPIDRDVVAMGGGGGGADTAVVICPANMNSFFDLKVREFIALPRLRVAEVLAPILRPAQQGMTRQEIAAGLGVSPALVEEYAELYDRVQELCAKGVPVDDALRQAGAHGDVLATLKELI